MAAPQDALDRTASRRELALSLGVLAALALLAGLTGLRDEDTFHLLADGRELVRRGGWTGSEPFLFPFAGTATGLSPSWLTSLAIFGSHALVGDAGPVLLAATALAALVIVLALDARDGGVSWREAIVAAAPLALAVAVLRPRTVARPEVLANVLLALTLLLVRRHESGRARSLLLVLPLVLVWTNLHQSAIAGVAAIGIYAAAGGALALAGRSAPVAGGGTPWRPVRHAALVAVLALLAAGAHLGSGNPVRTALSFVLSQAQVAPGLNPGLENVLSMMRRTIVELQPLSMSDWTGPFGMLVALTALSFLPSLRASSLREVLTAAAFVVLAIPTRRFSAHAAVVLAPIAARNLVVALRRHGAGLSRAARLTRGGAVPAGAAAVIAVVAAFALDRGMPFGTRLVAEKFPVRAASYLRSIRFDGRLYDSLHFGGYLEWTLGRPVFQDGRGLLREGDAQAALAGPSHPAAFDALDARYRFDALVLAYPDLSTGVREVLAAAGQADWAAPRDRWALVAFDDGGLLYLRRDGRYRERAAAEEYRFVLPANDFPLDRLGDPTFASGLVAELHRSVREAPACGGCRDWLGMALLQLGRDAEAAEVAGARLAEVKGLLARERAGGDDAAPGPSDAGGGDEAARLHALGREHVRTGRAAEAVVELRRSVELRPDDGARLDLAYALVEAGRPEQALPEVRAVIARTPASPAAQFVHGLVLESLGEHGSAAAAYRELLRLAPQSGEAALASARLRSLPGAR